MAATRFARLLLMAATRFARLRRALDRHGRARDRR
jgi:hypothetical protein